ncbi:MAG: hypothetical protein KAI24_18405 [Planctomycetes bacterium]|nr:hypothetical protein [Planctomycetota bacterium]
MSRQHTWFGAVALTSSLLYAQLPLPHSYEQVTNPFGSVVNFNVETVRGMLVRTAQPNSGLYALNTHASTVVFHGDYSPAYEAEWPTVNNPVSITEWSGGVLVVGGGTWALVEHQLTTGRILRQVELPAEPADIVVAEDANRAEAYIACQGANCVVRIDLTTFAETGRYQVGSQRPRFLFLEASTDSVYVAPFLSGNNSTVSEPPILPVIPGTTIPKKGSIDQRRVAIDLDDNDPNTTNLPDEDLYRIDMLTSSTIAPVLHNAGTLLTRHGRNPGPNGNYWMISTELHNAAHDSEDGHRGVFANAQLIITNNLGVGPRPTPQTVIDLDEMSPGAQKTLADTVSFPFAMAFHSSGAAAIASSTGDMIAFVDATGARQFNTAITPPAGVQWTGNAIPRDLHWDSTHNLLYVYCWGWNKVLLYDCNVYPTPLVLWFELGPDPLPLAMQRGRSIFYDATRQQDDNGPGGQPFHGAVTCNTCHPGGGMDLLGWELSDSEADVKDLMVTQSLLSISDTFPYHWRGERNLDHFNGAFKGLLGHKDVLSPSDLDDFQAFVFSLQAPANPHQVAERVLDGAEAQDGQDLFLNRSNVLLNEFSCADCHQLPGGTNGDGIREIFVGVTSTSTLDVTHLRQLVHKDQPSAQVTIPFDGGTVSVTRSAGGFGITHDGDNFDLQDFIKSSSVGGPFNITVPESQKITAFVRQFDQGIAPAAHRAYRIDAQNYTTTGDGMVRDLLLAQAAVGWVDVAAIGNESATSPTVRWAYDDATGQFTCSDPTLGARTWSGFQAPINGGATYTFVGLPPGGAWRFALDPDNDGLTDAQESNVSDPRDRDTDGDGYDDGYEVQVNSDPQTANVPADAVAPSVVGNALVLDHKMATFAKFRAVFSEPVKWELDAFDVAKGQVVSTTRSGAYVREATIHMHDFYPSTPDSLAPLGPTKRQYEPRLRITDLSGKTTSLTGPSFFAEDQLVSTQAGLPYKLRVTELGPAPNYVPPIVGGGRQYDFPVKVRFKAEVATVPSLSNRVVIARVLHRPAGSPTWTPLKAPDLGGANVQATLPLAVTSNGTSYTWDFGAQAGDYLLSSPLSAAGDGTFSFTTPTYAVGDEVQLAIIAILTVDPVVPSAFAPISLEDWDQPATDGAPTPTAATTDCRAWTFQF